MAKRDHYCEHRLDPSVGETRRPEAPNQGVDTTGQVAVTPRSSRAASDAASDGPGAATDEDRDRSRHFLAGGIARRLRPRWTAVAGTVLVGCATAGVLRVGAYAGYPARAAQIVWLGFGTGLTVVVITSP
jgi:hypothetical protein